MPNMARMVAQVCAMYGYPIHYVTSEIAIWDFYSLHLYGSEMKEIEAMNFAFENRLELFGYPKKQKRPAQKKQKSTIQEALTKDSVGFRKFKKEDLTFM